MEKRTSVHFIAVGFVLTLLAACANITPLSQLTGTKSWQPQATNGPSEAKCESQQRINFWTEDCIAWQKIRDAEMTAKRISDADIREKQSQAFKAKQEVAEREEEALEVAAKQSDERDGYKNLTFEDFALDSSKMQGAKVALRGIYVDQGQRFAIDQRTALMWIGGTRTAKGSLIPLFTEDASRATRARLLRCSEVPIGCKLVVRGRVRLLTLHNPLGVQFKELGVVVESLR